MAERKRVERRWLRLGCLGVVGIVTLLVLWTAVLFSKAWLSSRVETIERRSIAQDVAHRAAASADVPSPGRLVLDFAVGHFSVDPGEPGEPIRVDAEYDTRSYRLEQEYEPSSGSGWTYRVVFREIGWLRDGGLRGLLGGSYPRVRVRVPPDVPLALEGTFGKGFTQAELGGLWLTEIDLDMDRGECELRVSEPLAAPARAVRIHGSQGALHLIRLGNASPRRLEIETKMGGASIDLRGEWLNDSEVTIDGSMGGTDVFLPRDVYVEGLDAHGLLLSPRRGEAPAPTLKMSVSSFLGTLHVSD